MVTRNRVAAIASSVVRTAAIVFWLSCLSLVAILLVSMWNILLGFGHDPVPFAVTIWTGVTGTALVISGLIWLGLMMWDS